MNATTANLCRRRFMGSGAALALSGRAAWGQGSSKPLEIIVGYGPGGGTDLLARLIGIPLAKTAGRPVVVKNVPGAGGQIAASALLREGGDGLSVMAMNHPDLYMAVERGNAGFKISDFQVIMVDMVDPRVFLVKNGSDMASFADFVARAKAQPGQLAVSVAAGSAQEAYAKWLFSSLLGLDVTVVGYKGGAEASNALLAGDVAATIGDDFARFNLRQQVKALFIGAARKSPRWPEAPTLASILGPMRVSMPSPDFMARYGIYVVPSAFKARNPAGYAALQKALLQARASAEFQDYFNKNNLQDLSIGKPGEGFDAVFAADMVEIRKVK
ncbi:Bug family tripartite tricarboxylate transporter substrate binding protein [Ramlibacter sp.]|uniref:Bug family tripartite tricarboxylate transporter substrate binding protein n=1 Tax=Ramlibacter sp. TaxID=1917967 RepID=UPI003D127862